VAVYGLNANSASERRNAVIRAAKFSNRAFSEWSDEFLAAVRRAVDKMLASNAFNMSTSFSSMSYLKRGLIVARVYAEIEPDRMRDLEMGSWDDEFDEMIEAGSWAISLGK
jgi:hypothetical protein